MKYIVIIISLLLGGFIQAQHTGLDGHVFGVEKGDTIRVPDAKVFWVEHPVMETLTDFEGYYELAYHGGLYYIQIEHPLFETQKIEITEVEHTDVYLQPKSESLEGLTIQQRLESFRLDNNTALSYTIDKSELRKAACCNLSESFETNATVDVAYSNAATGSKQIRMLGLDQKYTSITKELLPEIKGISQVNGLTFIPGRWIESIQLVKGTPSVVNGYDGITGQINVEILQATEKPYTGINLYINNNLRTEATFSHTRKLNDKWNYSSLLFGSARMLKMDQNDDGFLDAPLNRSLNALQFFKYDDSQKSGWVAQLGLNYLMEHQTAGQEDFSPLRDRGSSTVYGITNDEHRLQIWNKTGKIFTDSPNKSIGWQNQFVYHQQDSYFGIDIFQSIQRSGFSNVIFENIIGNTNHLYKIGGSFVYDSYTDEYQNQSWKREEIVPGFFGEYTYTFLEKWSVVAGARVDFHSIVGTQFSPRLHVKYQPFDKTTFRANVGSAFRTAQLLVENQSYFISNRDLILPANNQEDIFGLKEEKAWNMGGSIQQEFSLFGRKNTLITDYFYTYFNQQNVVDLDASPQQVWFYSVEGSSAHSFQLEWLTEPIYNLKLRLAYKYYKVEIPYADGKRIAPLTPKNRGFLNVSYETQDGPWKFDTTLQYIGKQRIPYTNTNPTSYQLPIESESYFLLGAQINYAFSDTVSMYLGGENLLSYTQDNPIIQADNPFGNYFDASLIYAPIFGAMIYTGLDIEF